LQGDEDLNVGTTGTVLGSRPAQHRTDDVYVEVLVPFAVVTTRVGYRDRDVDANATCTVLGTQSPSVVPMVSMYLFRSFSPSRDAVTDYVLPLNVHHHWPLS
jgi:hypothetical protein